MTSQPAKALLSIGAALLLMSVAPHRAAAKDPHTGVQQERRASQTRQRHRRNRDRVARPVLVSQPEVIDRAVVPVLQDPNGVPTLTTDDVNHGQFVSEWRHQAIDAWKASGQGGPPPWAGVGGGPGGNPNHLGRGQGHGARHRSGVTTSVPVQPGVDDGVVRQPRTRGLKRTDRIEQGPRVVEAERGPRHGRGKGHGGGRGGGRPDRGPR